MGEPRWPMAWDAAWIWAGRPPVGPAFSILGASIPPEARNRFCFLRRTLALREVPSEAWARVTADSRFVLTVNGVEVARGPARAVPERIAYHSVDLAPHLEPGENVIAATVRYYGRANPWWRPAIPDGWLGLGGFALECPALEVRSDASWRGRPAPYRQDAAQPLHGLPTEEVDGRDWPSGFERRGFDDRSWEHATELTSGWPYPGSTTVVAIPYVAPEPSGIAELTTDPVELHAVAGSAYDADRITLATPWVVVEGPAGAEVEVVAGEDLDAAGAVVSAPRDYRLVYTLAGRGQPERIEGFEAVGFRYLGVRAGEGVRVVDVGATERRHPTAPGAWFRCDDDRLNRIWSVGARTLEVCATDAFLDCPGREQRAWLGDAYVHALLTYVTSTDWRLVRRHLRIAAQGQRPDGLLPMAAVGDLSIVPVTIPDYSLHWVRTLARYVQHTGDLETARELLPTVSGVIEAFERYRGDDGLLHGVPGWVFVDWAAVERGDVVGAVDALYALALDDHAWLQSGILGDEHGSAEARRRAQRTRAGFGALWDDERGVFVDALGGRRVSQQTNAVAILAGCASAGQWESILDAILDPDRLVLTPTTADMPPGRELRSQYVDPADHGAFDPETSVVAAQPFFSHFVHQAVVTAGRADLIADLCLRWWPQLERGNTTFEEYWDAERGRASRAHAWSATPTYDLTTHVLGIRPADVGYRRVIVEPAFAHLTHVAGAVPAPHGLIEADLTPAGGTLRLPPGVTADVRLPGVRVT